MERSQKCTNLEILPPAKHPTATTTTDVNLPQNQQLVQHPNHGRAHQTPPSLLRVPSKINLSIYHQRWQLRFMAHAKKYCPDADKTLQGQMFQTRQGVRYTKLRNTPAAYEATYPPPKRDTFLPTEDLHIWE